MIGLHDKARGKWRRHFVAPEIGRAMTQARRGISGRSARLRQPAERGLLRGSGQARPTSFIRAAAASAQVAQLVEQRTENPCVGSSILPLGTTPSDVGGFATCKTHAPANSNFSRFPVQFGDAGDALRGAAAPDF